MSFSIPEGSGFNDILNKNHTLTIGFCRVSKYYYLATKSIIDTIIKYLPISKKEIIKYLKGSFFAFFNVGPVSYCDILSIHNEKVFFYNMVNTVNKHTIYYSRRNNTNIVTHGNKYCYENKQYWNNWTMTCSYGINYKDIILSNKIILVDLSTVFRIYAKRRFDIDNVKNKTMEYLTCIYDTYSNTSLLNIYLAINCDIYCISYDVNLLKEVTFNNEDIYKTYISSTEFERQKMYSQLMDLISNLLYTNVW